MKTRLSIFILLVLVASLLGTACSDDKNSNDSTGTVPAAGKIVVTLDGDKTEFTGFFLMQTAATTSVAIASGSNPTGTGLTGASIMIYSLDGDGILTGDYEMFSAETAVGGSLTKYAVIGFSTAITSEVWVATEGTVTVTKKTDTELQGTFSGKVAKSTNGTSDLDNLKNFSGGFNVKPMSAGL